MREPRRERLRAGHPGSARWHGTFSDRLRDFSFLACDGQVRTGEQLDCNGQPAGYVESPEEVITHVDAHDNETLFDSLTLKLPQSTSMADRVRMNTLSLATAALAQTPSFWHAGADLLRSKSLDRHSDNSGDWFNVLDWSKRTNGFGRGPDALPGVVVMQVDDTVGRDVDTGLDGVLVVLDASPETVTVPVDGLAGESYRLSPVQAQGADPVVKAASWTSSSRTASVPRPDGRRVRRRPAARQARQAGEAWWAPRAVVGQGPDRPLSGGAGVTWDTPTPLCVRGANPIWAIAGMFGRQYS